MVDKKTQDFIINLDMIKNSIENNGIENNPYANAMLNFLLEQTK